MENSESKFNENNPWWKPAMFFYAKVTSWIIFPILLALVFSKYFLKGSQISFFILIFLGFIVSCYGIYKEIKTYKKGIEKNDNK